MNRQQLMSAFFAVLFLSGLASSADAATTRHGVTITNETSTDSSAFDSFTLGYRFDALANSSVASLGIWDFEGDGLLEAHDVGLWDATGTLLASATLASGTTDLLENGYRWVDLATSVPLLAGQTYTVAAYYDATNDDLVAGNATSATVDSRINVHGAVQLSGSSLAFPSTMLFPFSGSGGVFSYGGGNVMFAAGISAPACADGIDNDGDSFVDFPHDLGCTNALDNDEDLASPNLQPGDIAIVQYRTDIDDAVGGAGEEGFSFVALVDIPPLTQIIFTDEAWDGLIIRFDNRFPFEDRKEHGWLWSYQGASPAPAGTVFNCQGSTCDNNSTLSSPIRNLSGSDLGEQLIAYQGQTHSPTFLYALSNTPFITYEQLLADATVGVDSINENTTLLPPGLINGVSAHDFNGAIQNGYAGTSITSFARTREQFLAAINSDSFWDRGNSKTRPFQAMPALTVLPSVAPRLSVASSTVNQLKPSVLIINLGDPTGAAAINGIDFQIQQGSTPLAQLLVTATSDAPEMIAPSDLILQQVGGLWNLKITPTNIGVTDIKVSVSDGTYFHDYVINVIVMPPAPLGGRFHGGIADASTAIALGNGKMMVAGDEHVGLTDGIHIYDRTKSDWDLGRLDFSVPTGLFWQPILEDPPSELDLEGSLADGDISWWIGSSSNNKNGKCRPNRHGLYKVDISSGVAQIVGFRRDIRDEFYTWDRNNAHGRGVDRYGFINGQFQTNFLINSQSCWPELPDLPGYTEWIAKRGDSFNIEGLARTPLNYDDYSPEGMIGKPTALVGFRSPIVAHQRSVSTNPTQLRTRALLVPMVLESGSTNDGPPIAFGEPIELDLGGRGVRSISRNEQGEYLIIAGSYGEHGEPLEADWIAAWADAFGPNSPPPPAPNDFKLYTWTGNDPDISLDPADMPVLQTADLTTLRDGTGSFEGIVEAPTPLAGSTVQLVVDDGAKISVLQEILVEVATVFTGKKIANFIERLGKLSAPRMQRFRSYEVAVDPHRCFATGDDGVTVYASYDAQAIQNVMHNLIGSTIKIAGQCEGQSIEVNSLGQKIELGAALELFGSVTLIGGFSYDPLDPDATDWDAPDPVANPTRIASGGTGFVISNVTDLTIKGINIDGPAGQLFAGTNGVQMEVWNNNDNGPGSLREAIADAPAGSFITFAPGLSDGLPITLAGTQLSLDKDVTISTVLFYSELPTPYVKGLTISGNNLSRVFSISNGVNVTLNGLIITGGNTAGNGAGIDNNGGNLTLVDSTVHGNTSGNFGGGIMNDQGSVTITNSTFTDNVAAFGGAFFNSLTTATIRHSTIVSNDAVGFPGITTGQGGGIRNGGGTVFLSNSIVAENTSNGPGPDIYNPSGSTMVPGGNNLIGNNAGTDLDFPDTDPLVGNALIPLSPLLSPLGDNGGSTLTRKPLAGSPAINSAPPSSVVVDQRGILRPQGVGSDLGAVEIRLTVTSMTDDASPGSLRQIITNAPAGSVITFASNLATQDIILGGTQLLIDKNLTIDASALPNGLIINGNGNSRVFEITAGSNVTLKGLTITGGIATNGSGHGLMNSGSLTLIDTTVTENGLNDTGFGGAVYNTGALLIENSTLSNNHAREGGAINNRDVGTTATLLNVTIYGNTAFSCGGGICNLFDASLSLNHTTITGNIITGNPGGGVGFSSGNLAIENSIIADNTATTQNREDFWYSGGTITPTGANLIGDNASVSAYFPLGSLVGDANTPLKPQLAVPGYYGGRTQNMPPLLGSPTLDTAPVTANSPTTDQRGLSRPIGAGPDIGAVEQHVSDLDVIDSDGDGIFDAADNCPVTSNANQLNNDGDQNGDACDTDDDNDGVLDGVDAFPLDASETVDTDGDRVGNNADTDDDNDTIPDSLELSTGRDPLVVDWMVSAGAYHSCALDDNGATCWGDNTYGQTTVPVLSNPIEIDAGFNYSCALDDNGMSCWGINTSGQATVPALSNPVAMSLGATHTCAIDDNGVSCWGSDTNGKATVPVLSNPVAVSAGGSHTCVLDDNGVTCWGLNHLGQITVPVLSNPVALYSGVNYVCAIDDNGVTCWGDDFSGQSTPPVLSNPYNVIAAGSHTCALDDSAANCWGNDTDGQSTVPALRNPVVANPGGFHTCALDDNGVHCWGLNDKGQSTVPVLAFDKDSDGLLDSIEDANANGIVDAGETDSLNADSDGDGLLDGIEDANQNGFFDMGESDPLNEDTDGDGLLDGVDPFPLVAAAPYDGDLAPLGSPDGIINVADFLIAQRIVIGDLTATQLELDHGDVYPPGAPDGVINIQDLLLIQQMVLQ